LNSHNLNHIRTYGSNPNDYRMNRMSEEKNNEDASQDREKPVLAMQN
jgi:hypothetical protein